MACGKYRFRDRIAAEMALMRIGKKNGVKRQEIRSYRCWACNGAWHLTSQKKGKRG